jgi:hypothetical protein
LDNIPEATTIKIGTMGVCRMSPLLPEKITRDSKAKEPTHYRIVLTDIASILDDRYLRRTLLPAHVREATRAMITPSMSLII